MLRRLSLPMSTSFPRQLGLACVLLFGWVAPLYATDSLSTEAHMDGHSANLCTPLFRPLLADYREPRIAVTNSLEGNQLSLDIGASLDLMRLTFPSSRIIHQLGVGADFGTFSLLRKEPNFKFPVEAADYIFGLLFSAESPSFEWLGDHLTLTARLRVSHISAHLIDGSYDPSGNWINGEPPFVFSREFVGIVIALNGSWWRGYLGYEVLFNSIPRGFSPSTYQAGGEMFYGVEFVSPITLFSAIDFRLSPIWRPSVMKSAGVGGTTSIMAGLKLGKVNERGVRVFYNYVGGVGWRGMYRTAPISYHGVGVILDL